ncbi:hypothetical protein SDC9_134816 [bioreactor metagenome]|uniref:Uncharacterized protein n=1 Tax=bioreactor metagenome TaxID=1076179 RepID=A0A645DEB7_9ZZZZ
MNYKLNQHYKSEYLKSFIMLIPLYVLIFKTYNIEPIINPVVFIYVPVIFATEYSYVFLRRAMEVYENILFRTFSKRLDMIVELLIVSGTAVAQGYYISTGNPILIIIMGFIYLLWDLGLKNHSLVIGDKGIIIGRRLFPHSSINSIDIKNEELIINTTVGLFVIHKWAINRRTFQLESVIREFGKSDLKENS